MDYQDLGQCLGFKGINADFIPELIPMPDEPIFLRDGNNILIRNGKVEKLRGTDYLNSISTQQGIADYRTILGFPIYRKYSGDKYLMAVTPQRLYYLLSNTSWSNIGTINNGLNESVLSSANIDNYFVFTLSDSTFIWYWDGANFGKLFIPPQDDNLRARFLLRHKTHLILFRPIESTVEKYQRVWPSFPGDIDHFDDEDKVDLESGGVIEGAKRLEDIIIGYCDDSIHKIQWGGDEVGYVYDPLVEGQGLLCPKTLCGTKDVHFFVTSEGLMRLVKGDVPRCVSKEKFNRLILEELDPVNYKKAVQYFYPHLALLFLTYPKSGSTYNDTQLVYDTLAGDLVSKKILVNEFYSAYGDFEKDLSTLGVDERKLYGLGYVPIFGTKDGYIKEQKITEYSDGLSTYESNLTLPPTFFKDRSQNKRLMEADLIIEKFTNETINFILEISNEMNAKAAPYSFPFTGTGDIGIRRYILKPDSEVGKAGINGKEFTIKLKDVNNPYGWSFHGAIFRGYYTGTR